MQVGRLKIADVCAGDAILARYLLGDVPGLITHGYNPRKLIAKGFEDLVRHCSRGQLESWDDKDGTCIFMWGGAGVV